ncbi:MAG: class A beta-lactamase [Methyloligellaceae bacterium]
MKNNIKYLNRLAVSLILFAILQFQNHIVFAQEPILKKIKEVEQRLGGARIGMATYDLETGKRLQYNADQLFPLSSTFKVFLCGAILGKVDKGKEKLSRTVRYSREQIVSYSPVTKDNIPNGMTVGELCHSTVTMSDNTAANLLMETIGGPGGLTDFMKDLGDKITRIDRWETELNQGKPEDVRDTTTPNAALTSLHKLLFGKILSERSKQQLATWMIQDQVAASLFRKNLPEGWKIGDKTGAGGYGSRSIIAVIWPPKRKPVIATLYITGNKASFKERNMAIADIGQALFLSLEK